MVYGSIMTQFHECNTRIMHFSNIFCHKLFQHMYYKVKHHDAGFVFKTYLPKDAIAITGFCYIYKTNKVQLGPRYEGQLNPMAEPIPHEVRPLVRTHVYHPYQARTDRQRPIVVFNRRGRVFAPFCGCSLKSRECYNHGPRMASS